MACLRIIESEDELDQPNEEEVRYEMDEIRKAANEQGVIPALAALLVLGDLGNSLSKRLGVITTITEGEEDEEETEPIGQGDSHSA